jgi:hypothetical protein
VVHKTTLRNEHCGEVMLNRIFKELKAAGYLKLEEERENGKIVERAWIVSDEPMLSSGKVSKTLDYPNGGKPQLEETSTVDNQVLQRKNNTNKEKPYTNKERVSEIQYSDKFTEIWDNVYPHTIDRGSKPRTYKNWCNLLKEGLSEDELVSAASNYRTVVRNKRITAVYKASNFYGEARYFENFQALNLSQLNNEVNNERKQPTTAAGLSAAITEAFRDM